MRIIVDGARQDSINHTEFKDQAKAKEKSDSGRYVAAKRLDSMYYVSQVLQAKQKEAKDSTRYLKVQTAIREAGFKYDPTKEQLVQVGENMFGLMNFVGNTRLNDFKATDNNIIIKQQEGNQMVASCEVNEFMVNMIRQRKVWYGKQTDRNVYLVPVAFTNGSKHLKQVADDLKSFGYLATNLPEEPLMPNCIQMFENPKGEITLYVGQIGAWDASQEQRVQEFLKK